MSESTVPIMIEAPSGAPISQIASIDPDTQICDEHSRLYQDTSWGSHSCPVCSDAGGEWLKKESGFWSQHPRAKASPTPHKQEPMGNANNLPFDILPYIFQPLYRSDLVAAALVNRTFASGALPRLYEHIIIRLSFVKRIDSVRSSSRVGLHD